MAAYSGLFPFSPDNLPVGIAASRRKYIKNIVFEEPDFMNFSRAGYHRHSSET